MPCSPQTSLHFPSYSQTPRCSSVRGARWTWPAPITYWAARAGAFSELWHFFVDVVRCSLGTSTSPGGQASFSPSSSCSLPVLSVAGLTLVVLMLCSFAASPINLQVSECLTAIDLIKVCTLPSDRVNETPFWFDGDLFSGAHLQPSSQEHEGLFPSFCQYERTLECM